MSSARGEKVRPLAPEDIGEGRDEDQYDACSCPGGYHDFFVGCRGY